LTIISTFKPDELACWVVDGLLPPPLLDARDIVRLKLAPALAPPLSYTAADTVEVPADAGVP
jgi:hypothetical protein